MYLCSRNFVLITCPLFYLVCSRMAKRKCWKPDDMQRAMDAVCNDKVTISDAARRFEVPRKTLDDRMKGLVQHGTSPGPKTVLTAVEEAALVQYLVYMAQRSFPLTRTMVMAFAWAIAKRTGKADRFNPEYGPSKHWWSNFRKRHPKLTLRKSDKLDRCRAEAYNAEVVDEYFNLLQNVLKENNLLSAPRQLYNCDETFLPLDTTREKVVTLKNTKHVYSQAQGTSDHITMLCGASAAGIPLPPMIIYPKSFPGGPYTVAGPDDAVYAKSESGWVDSDLFLSWLKKSFLKFAVPQRPLILFVDGHSSHVTLDVIDLARENDVVIFCLPPHTTHALQPLDVAVFKSLKDFFSKSVRALCFAKKNFIVSKREFARVVKGPFERAFSIPNIKAGFAKSGIFPFNPNAIDRSKMISGSSSSQSSESQPTTESSETETVSHQPTDQPLGTPRLETSEELPSSSLLSSSFSFSDSQLETSTPIPETTPSVSHSSDSMVDSSVLACATPSPMVSPWQSQMGGVENPIIIPSSIPVTPHSSGRSTPRSLISNPLVAAGLIPEDLADILSAPEETTATKRRRITGARVLTADEYYKMMEEKDRKEKEAAELKEKRKQEREEKKREREQKKAEKEQQKAEKERQKADKRKGKGKKQKPEKSQQEAEKEGQKADKKRQEKQTFKPQKRKCADSQEKTSKHQRLDDDSTDSDGEQPGPSCRPKRTRQLPARFCVDSEESDSVDDTQCEICDKRVPEGVKAAHIFWIDCDKCGCWVHTACAFGNNFTSKKYICDGCV